MINPAAVGGQYFKAHSNTFETGHPLVRLARPGDRVVVWARAKYPVSRGAASEYVLSEAYFANLLGLGERRPVRALVRE